MLALYEPVYLILYFVCMSRSLVLANVRFRTMPCFMIAKTGEGNEEDSCFQATNEPISTDDGTLRVAHSSATLDEETATNVVKALSESEVYQMNLTGAAKDVNDPPAVCIYSNDNYCILFIYLHVCQVNVMFLICMLDDF